MKTLHLLFQMIKTDENFLSKNTVQFMALGILSKIIEIIFSILFMNTPGLTISLMKTNSFLNPSIHTKPQLIV